MARLFTTSDGVSFPQGGAWGTFNASVAAETSTFVTGAKCERVTVTTGGGTAVLFANNGASSLNVARFVRAYLYFTQWPSSNVGVFGFGAGFNGCSIRVGTNGATQLWTDQGTIAQIGSDGPTLSRYTWYCFEVGAMLATGANDYVEGKIDGQTFAKTTTASITDTATELQNVQCGAQGGAGGTLNDFFFIDEVAMNDATTAKDCTWVGPYRAPVQPMGLTR